MTDSIDTNAVVSMPSQFFTMARFFKAVANGEVYTGKIDINPVNPENRVQVYVESEDGSHVPVSQPIIINATGYSVCNEQIAKFVTVQDHPMTVYDTCGTKQFCFPSMSKCDPDQLRTITGSPEGVGHVECQYCRDTGSTMKVVSDVLGERMSLWDSHCDPSDNVIQSESNVDSRQYLQVAIDYVSSNGGGTIIIPAGYTWYLGPYGAGRIAGHSGIIQLRSNVNLNTEGKIHLSPFFDLRPFQVSVGFDSADPSASGNPDNCNIFGRGVIDFGGYNFSSASQLRCGIAFGRSCNCSVTGVTFQNGDVTWAITTGWNNYGSNCCARKCQFINPMNSNVNRDYSTAYIGCPYSGVDICYFSMASSFTRQIACSVELHQYDTFYRNSIVNGYYRGVYVIIRVLELGGASAYGYNMQVQNSIVTICGQFVIPSSDASGAVTAHFNDVLVSGNVTIIGERAAYSIPFSAFTGIAPDNNDVNTTQDIKRVLVAGNTFYAPINITGSAVVTIRVNINDCTISGNVSDCHYMIYSAPGMTTVQAKNLVWDKSNTIGYTHVNQRTEQNLLDMQFTSVVNSTIEVQLSCEGLSMFGCIFFPTPCQLSYSKIAVDSAWTNSMSSTAAFEGNQQTGANVYVSYPATVNLISYNTQRVVPFSSIDTNYT